MTATYDLFWSFRSPYSYLVTPGLLAMEDEFDIRCNARPVYPTAVRAPEFFDKVNPLWFSYFAIDLKRSADFLGLPIRWPRPDPVYQDPETKRYPAEQPYIHRLTRLGVAASERGRGIEFMLHVSHLIFHGGVDNWHEGDHLAAAAEKAGLDLAELDAAITHDPDRYEAAIQESQHVQARHHWGVPLMVYKDEPFFGQDRLDQLRWRLEQDGLRKR